MPTLNEYMSMEGAMTNRELADAIRCDAAQVRQWRAVDAAGEPERRPGAAYCVAIERATKGRVKRSDLRPDDWSQIWPELVPKKSKQAA